MAIIFDASALLVLLNKEPGCILVEKYISQAIMSAVNFAEVVTVLIGIGISHSDSVAMTSGLIAEIIAFDEEQASISAALRDITKPFGLSLGDRACLALAQYKQLPVVTADKIWAKLEMPIEVILVR